MWSCRMSVTPADRDHLVSMVALLVFLVGLATITHGCYGPNEGPPCSASDTACGCYPSSPSFMHKHSDGGQ